MEQLQAVEYRTVQQYYEELEGLSSEQVIDQFMAAMVETVEAIKKAAACVRWLDERGVQVPRGRTDAVRALRLIANGQLSAKAYERL